MRHLNPMRPTAAQRGLTLIELMVALSIAAMLAMAAAPSFSDYLANSRLRENGNALYSQTLFAQSEAIKRNTVVRMTVTSTSITVTDRSDPDNPVTLRTVPFSNGISAAASTVDFGGEGRPVAFASASINVSHPTMSCSSEIRCPGLRIDGGGGVRMCNDHTASSCS